MEKSDGSHMDIDADAGVPVRISAKDRRNNRMRLVAHDANDVDIRRVEVPHAFKLLHQEVQAMGVDMRLLVSADVKEGEDDALPRIHDRVRGLLMRGPASASDDYIIDVDEHGSE